MIACGNLTTGNMLHLFDLLILFTPIVHNLMNALVRNPKLPRKLRLRNTGGVSSTYDDIALTGREGGIRRRGM